MLEIIDLSKKTLPERLKTYLSNEDILDNYILNCSKSKNTRKTTKTYLNHFFKSFGKCKGRGSKKDLNKQYYGFKGHILDINDEEINSYFRWLDDNPDCSLYSKKLYFGGFIKFLHHLINFYKFPLEKKISFYFLLNDRTCFNFSAEQHHKRPKNNHHIVLTKDETESILLYLKLENYRKYIEFRLLVETGMRIGELISIQLSRNYKGEMVPLREDIENRFIVGNGKKGEKAYYFSKEMQEILLKYLESRLKQKINSNHFLLSSHNKKYKYPQSFNNYITNYILPATGINKSKRPISPQCFRRTLNTLRKKIGCEIEDRQILLNHKTGKVNLDNYVVLNREEFLEMYDKWNPYKRNNYML